MAPTTAASKPALQAFHRTLEECTLKSFDDKDFVLVAKLKEWLKGSPEGIGTTRVKELLCEACIRTDRPFLPVADDAVCRDGLLVFSILLEIGRGDRIDDYLSYHLVDQRLPFALAELKTNLRTNWHPNDDAELRSEAELFDAAQWKYCAPFFNFDENHQYSKQIILPIRRRIPINDKGGTARLWRIEVPAEFVGDSLRSQVKNSERESRDQYGKCHHFALKTFTENNKEMYLNEKEAFNGLRGQNGVVKRLATFSCPESAQTSTGSTPTSGVQSADTYNILFEFGEMDLDEYFVQKHPPFLDQEILAFWENLFEVVGPVAAIHNLKTSDSGQSFHGWHADIKPDNILLVNGKFKLADPGFAKFIKKTGKDPRELITGGTWTYGAPERCRRTQPVTPKIDVWSLGCVFSIAATWVVGGLSAVRDFNRIRQKALKSIEVRSDDESGNGRSDCFHDGKEVLANVSEWHALLGQLARRNDHITCCVLELVDQKMLVPDGQRSSASQLNTTLRNILISNRPQSLHTISPSIMRALHEINEEAPPVLTSSSTWQIDKLDKEVDPKTRKSIVMGYPMKKTALRSEYLTSALSEDSRQSSSVSPTTISSDFKKRGLNGITPPSAFPGPHLQLSTNHTLQAAQASSETTTVKTALQIPNTVQKPHEPQDFFQAQENLLHHAWFSMWRRRDPVLKKYIRDRDIVFLVDNAGTMKKYWAQLKALIKVLIEKIGHLDKDGIDVYFTVGQRGLKLKTGSKVKRRMSKAQPESKGPPTDMEAALGNVLSKHIRHMQHSDKNLTLIILTDGIWKGTNSPHAVRDKIISTVKQVGQMREHQKRPLTFQFIQFGTNEEAKDRLQYLDNLLPYDADIEDVADLEHASGDVLKMILGSFVEQYDWSDPSSSRPPS